MDAGRYETILVDIDEGIGTVTLNRIEQRNALNSVMLRELGDACTRLDRDDNVRVIVIRSACEGVFCAGADVKEREGMTEGQLRERRKLARDTYELLERIEKPMICAVNGKNFGGGCEIAACCDFIISSNRASFCYPEVRWGTLGATQRLTRLVGKSLAKYYLLTARTITAEEAYRIGLTAVLVDESEFDRTVREIAAQIASYSPLSVRLTKKSVNVGAELDMTNASFFEVQAIETLIAHNEWQKGVEAFMRRNKNDNPS